MTAVRENILFLKKIENELSSHGVSSARAEAEQLIEHFSGVSRAHFFAGEKKIGAAARTRAARAARVRAGGEPLSYIVKQREFYGRAFRVGPGVLIPRPETEILVREALKIIDQHCSVNGIFPEILDLGTGSGCIAVSLTSERPGCRMTALDVSARALQIALKNIRLHGLQKKITLRQSDLFGALDRGTSWDLIVSNPPYVPEEDIPALPAEVRREPRAALDGGPGGLGVIRRILDEAPFHLKPQGWLLLEIGDGQSKILKHSATNGKRYRQFGFVKDLAGIERILVAQRN